MFGWVYFHLCQGVRSAALPRKVLMALQSLWRKMNKDLIKWNKFKDLMPEKYRDLYISNYIEIVVWSAQELLFELDSWDVDLDWPLWAYIPIPPIPKPEPEYQRCDHCNAYPKLCPTCTLELPLPPLKDGLKGCDYCDHWLRDPKTIKFSCP